MSFIFRVAAPLFKRGSRRWTQSDFDWLASRLQPYMTPGGQLLDLGGGTGDLGSGIADALGCEAVILDATPQMLDLVTPHPLVSTVLGQAEALPFPDASFDTVFCCDAFHHFRHQDAAAAEMARVVRPGGAVLLLEMRPDGWGRLLALFERLLGEPGRFRRPEELERHLAAHSISGVSEGQGGISYLYLGVREPGAGAAG